MIPGRDGLQRHHQYVSQATWRQSSGVSGTLQGFLTFVQLILSCIADWAEDLYRRRPPFLHFVSVPVVWWRLGGYHPHRSFLPVTPCWIRSSSPVSISRLRLTRKEVLGEKAREHGACISDSMLLISTPYI